MARQFGNNADYGLGYYLTLLAIWFLIFIGWVLNVIEIWHTVDNPITAKFVLRVVGIFIAPIGAVLGFLS